MKNRKRNPEPKPAAKTTASAASGLPWWAVAAAGLFAFIVYFPALRGPFLFDDLNLPMLVPGGPGGDWLFFFRRGIRAVSNLSFVADYRLWGLNPLPFHAQGWLLHLLNTILAYRILRILAEKTGTTGMMAWLGAGFGAGVFLLHPIQTEAVSYIASRSELLSVFFAYLALLVFLQDRNESIGWGRALAILALFGLAMLSKETVIAMTAVILLADFFFRGDLSVSSVLRNWRLYAPMLVGGVAGGLAFLRVAGREGSAGFQLQGVTAFDYLVTQFEAFWIYVRLLVLPFGQNLDHAFPMAKAPGGIWNWLCLGGILALVIAAWLYRRRFPLAAFGFFTFLFLLAPTSSILPIADAVAERRLYLPMIGLLLVILEALRHIRIGHAVTAGLAAILLLLGILTLNRNEIYSSSLAMWADSVEKNPTNSRAHFQYAYALYQQGRCAEASDRYANSASLKQPDYRLLVDWALALDCAGKADDALSKLRTATGLERDSHAWSLMGMIHGKRGESGAALDAIEKALAINPRDDMALVYRGNVRMMNSQAAEARKDFQAALDINPNNQAAQQGLVAAARR